MEIEELEKKVDGLNNQIKLLKQKAVREGIRHLEPEHPFFKLNQDLKECQQRLTALKEPKNDASLTQPAHSP